MKIVKTLLFLLVFTGFNQLNAQSILTKWEDLSNFSQILTKVNSVAELDKFEYMDKVSPIFAEYTEKLDVKNVPAILGRPKVTETITKLKKQTKDLNELALKKAPKDQLQNTIAEINLTYNELLKLCNID